MATTTKLTTRRGIRLRLDTVNRPFSIAPWPYAGPPPRCASRAWHDRERPVPPAEGIVLVTLQPGDLLMDVPLCAACLARVPPAAP